MRLFFLAILAGIGMAAASSFPADMARLETKDGRVYEGLRQIRVSPSRISFLHACGAASVKLGDLPADLQALAGFDPAAAEKHERKQAEAEAKADAAIDKELSALASGDKARRALIDEAYRQVGTQAYQVELPSWHTSRRNAAKSALKKAGIPDDKAEKMIREWIEAGRRRWPQAK